MLEKKQLNSIFANNLRNYLKLKKKTQKDLIEDLGFSSGIVSEWATAKKYPRIDHIQSIADYLGIYKFQLIEDTNVSSTLYVSESASAYQTMQSIVVETGQMEPFIYKNDILYYSTISTLVEDAYYIIHQHNKMLVYKYQQERFLPVSHQYTPLISENVLNTEQIGILKKIVRNFE